MSVEEAAKLLQAKLDHPSWLNMVGIGSDHGRVVIVVYIRPGAKMHAAKWLNESWQGFPVLIKTAGSPRPLHT